MMTNVETVLRLIFEALIGCTMTLKVPRNFYNPQDLDPAYPDESNNSDDDKNNGDSDYHHHNNLISNNSNCNSSSNINSPSQGTVHRRSEDPPSTQSSSRLDAGEEQDEGLDESTDPACTICHREFGSVEDDDWFNEYGILYNCQHSFCRYCIQRWLRQFAFENRKCPVCRCHTVYCVSSPRWLSHNSPDKDSLLCCSPRWAMIQKLVRRCLSSLAAVARLHLNLSSEAFKELVAKLIFDQESLYHRHEVMSIL